MSENNASVQRRRRTINSSAWSLPVISAAAAVPARSASSHDFSPTEHWGVSDTVDVASGNTASYTIFGLDAQAKPAELPAGSSLTITAESGVTLELVDSDGFVVEVHDDGSIVATVPTHNRTLASVYFKPFGTSGSAYTVIAEVDLDPYITKKQIVIL